MTDHELQSRLNRLHIAAPASGAAEKVWERARVAFVSHREPPAAKTRSTQMRRVWAMLAAVGICASAAPFLQPRKHGVVATLNPRILAEMEALFPSQLSAVVARGDQLTLELSDQDVGSRSQPVELTLRRDGKAVQVLTYSGSRACVHLGGSTLCFETLATMDGGTVLVGDRFVWQSGTLQAVDGYQIQARAGHAL